MGFDVDQFEEEINEELICSICAGVLEDAITTHCDHLFCSDCIHDWLRVNATCPIDRCHLRACMLKPAPRAIRNLVNRLRIHCNFAADGCAELIALERYYLHLDECVYNPARLVKCRLWCKRTMTARALRTHNCLHECMDRIEALERKCKQTRNERDMLTLVLLLLLVLYVFCPLDRIVALIMFAL